MITRAERVANLAKELGRRPTLNELIAESAKHTMTPAEVEAQRQSWVRGMTARCEHGKIDFETCPQCLVSYGGHQHDCPDNPDNCPKE